jgi:hypothetical protein
VNEIVSDVWDFKKDASGSWKWQRQSLRHELIRECERPFASFEECVADARRCGYSGSPSVSSEPQRDGRGRLLRGSRR